MKSNALPVPWLCVLLASYASANNIQVSDVRYYELDAANEHVFFDFKLSWENSWRSSFTKVTVAHRGLSIRLINSRLSKLGWRSVRSAPTPSDPIGPPQAIDGSRFLGGSYDGYASVTGTLKIAKDPTVIIIYGDAVE